MPLANTLVVLEEGGFEGFVCVEIGQLAPAADERELVRSGLSWRAQFGEAAEASRGDGRGSVDELVDAPFGQSGGWIAVPDRPGIGVHVNEALVRTDAEG